MQATLNDTSSYLSSLINAGADAMSNLFYVRFSGGLVDPSISTALTVRTSEITFPTVRHQTEKKHFMTVSMDAPKADIDIEKTLRITLRLDEDYAVYKYLQTQQKTTSIPNLGFAATKLPDEDFLSGAKGSNDGFIVSVYAPTSEITQFNQVAPELSGITSNYRKMYEYRKCWISEITPPRYTYANSNVLTVSAAINFYEFDDPQSLLK